MFFAILFVFPMRYGLELPQLLPAHLKADFRKWASYYFSYPNQVFPFPSKANLSFNFRSCILPCFLSLFYYISFHHFPSSLIPLCCMDYDMAKGWLLDHLHLPQVQTQNLHFLSSSFLFSSIFLLIFSPIYFVPKDKKRIYLDYRFLWYFS